MIPLDYKHWIIACKTEHLITHLAVSELLLTCSLGNKRYIIHPYLYCDPSPSPYPYPSILLHESRSHDDHIYVHIYVDELRERQAVMHED
jgi:hypothetical protein